jgi:ribosomal protein S18 acetylase RimI-like enzyme
MAAKNSAFDINSSPTPQQDYVVRAMCLSDLENIAAVGYEAYCEFNSSVNLAAEFPSESFYKDVLIDGLKWQSNNIATGIVIVKTKAAATENPVLASGFISYPSPNEPATIGMIAVTQNIQAKGIGKVLMNELVAIYKQKQLKSVRLVQIGANIRSFSLYAAVGFEARELLTCIGGTASQTLIKEIDQFNKQHNRVVRVMQEKDLPACNNLFKLCNGVDRIEALRIYYQYQYKARTSDLYGWRRCFVIEQNNEIIGYSVGFDVSGNQMAIDENALIALFLFAERLRQIQLNKSQDEASNLPTSEEYKDPDNIVVSTIPLEFHVLSLRNANLLRRLILAGLRCTRQLTLMTIGQYSEPKSQYIYGPSIEW